ncbi:heterokaryon incompatibility protein-domain-containing protein [Xylariales sp. AK1849]|nr:heterokaryon incompatibility protein-domain-containing protein [Xylariales sp. AK1849]
MTEMSLPSIPSATTLPKTSMSTTLCESCRAIDFSKIKNLWKSDFKHRDTSPVQRKLKYFGERLWSQSVHIVDVGKKYNSRPTNGCDLCLALYTYQMPVMHKDSATSAELRAFPLCRITGHKERSNSPAKNPWTAVAAIVVISKDYHQQVWEYACDNTIAKGYLTCWDFADDEWLTRTPGHIRPHFEVATVSEWLRECDESHGNCARSDVRISIDLIDCHCGEIVAADTSFTYLALSYVWGEVQFTGLHHHARSRCVLPSELPSVIRDAIDVTAQLGFRYLWVDQLCIDQSDQVSKQHQIKHMGSIYNNAEVTIVSASGADAEYGLPGAPRRPRHSRQVSITLKDYKIGSVQRHPVQAILGSQWNTRGWTYQEAFLSRRLLCFTDDEIYYQCGTKSHRESFCHPDLSRHIPPASISTEEDDVIGTVYSQGPLRRAGMPSGNIFTKHELFSYLDHVQEYTKRILRYDGDVLLAFTSIINASANSSSSWMKPLPSVQGMVFFEDSRIDRDAYLAFSLAWHHITSSSDPAPPRRRHQFPSWTWAGWVGPVYYDLTRFLLTKARPVLSLENVHVKEDLGVSGSWGDTQHAPIFDAARLDRPAYLCFNAVRLPADALQPISPSPSWEDRGPHSGEYQMFGYHVSLYYSDNLDRFRHTHPQAEHNLESVEKVSYEMVLLGHLERPGQGAAATGEDRCCVPFYGLILRKDRSSLDVFERVGLIRFLSDEDFMPGDERANIQTTKDQEVWARIQNLRRNGDMHLWHVK